jgi:hypothetical protein
MMNDMSRFRVPDTLKAAALYGVLTVLLAYPLSVLPGEAVFGDNPDTHLFIWTLAWDAHAFLHHPLTIFDANIYYPFPHTLAYSENLIGLALFSAPVQWLTGNPVLAMNVAALLACLMCGVGAYVLAARLGLSSRAALICGLVFAFSPARFVRTGQLHVGAVQWIPFTLAYLHAYLDRGGKWNLRLAAAFFALQALTSGHGAVFLTAAAGGLIAYRCLLGEPLALTQRLRDFGVSGALLVAPAVLVYVPYRRVRLEMGFRRTFEAWEPTPESFLAARTHFQGWLLSWFPGPHPNETATAYFFPGWLPLLLSAIAIVSFIWLRVRSWRSVSSRRWQPVLASLLELAAVLGTAVGLMVVMTGPMRFRIWDDVLFSARSALRPLGFAVASIALRIVLRRAVPFSLESYRRQLATLWPRWSARAAEWRRAPTPFYVLLTLTSALILMAPPIGIWPHVFWLPGFNLIRAPGRFVILTVLGIAVLAAIGFDRLVARFSQRGQSWLTAVTVVLMLGEFAGMPLPAFPFRVDYPAADRWLADQPESLVIAEFPVLPSARYQTLYMLHSMANWHKTVHGYSGYEAQMHTVLYNELRGFPDELSCRRLRELGVTYAVVHEGLYPPGIWPTIEERLKLFEDQLKLEYSTPGARVYSLRKQP